MSIHVRGKYRIFGDDTVMARSSVNNVYMYSCGVTLKQGQKLEKNKGYELLSHSANAIESGGIRERESNPRPIHGLVASSMTFDFAAFSADEAGGVKVEAFEASNKQHEQKFKGL